MSRPMKQEPNRSKWGIPALQGGEEVNRAHLVPPSGPSR